jgi:hypothetical protein
MIALPPRIHERGSMNIRICRVWFVLREASAGQRTGRVLTSSSLDLAGWLRA